MSDEDGSTRWELLHVATSNPLGAMLGISLRGIRKQPTSYFFSYADSRLALQNAKIGYPPIVKRGSVAVTPARGCFRGAQETMCKAKLFL
jgi:hypothetical protein